MASKMASKVAVDEDNISCPVCLSVSRNMRSLTSCGHSICLKCLRRMHEHAGPRGPILKCPECKIPIKLPPSGKVHDLPINYMVRRIVDDGDFEMDSEDEEVDPELTEVDTAPRNTYGQWNSISSYPNESPSGGGGQQTQQTSEGFPTAGVVGAVAAGALALGGFLLYRHTRKDK